MKAVEVTRPNISNAYYHLRLDEIQDAIGEIEDIFNNNEVGDVVCFKLVEFPEGTLETSEEFTGW